MVILKRVLCSFRFSSWNHRLLFTQRPAVFPAPSCCSSSGCVHLHIALFVLQNTHTINSVQSHSTHTHTVSLIDRWLIETGEDGRHITHPSGGDGGSERGFSKVGEWTCETQLEEADWADSWITLIPLNQWFSKPGTQRNLWVKYKLGRMSSKAGFFPDAQIIFTIVLNGSIFFMLSTRAFISLGAESWRMLKLSAHPCHS